MQTKMQKVDVNMGATMDAKVDATKFDAKVDAI